MQAMQIVVSRCGDVRCIYTEVVELHALGEALLWRASTVEPDERGRWWADLAPVAGPTLGPFGRRSEALAAEEGWLAEHWLVGPPARHPSRI
jgi:hypothetical protein